MTKVPRLPHPLLEPTRDPRRFVGAAVSLVFHLLILGLILRGAVDRFIATPSAGDPMLARGGGGGGGGGQRVRYITLPSLPRTAVPAPAQQPTVPPPKVVPPTPVPAVPPPTPAVVVAKADSVPAAGTPDSGAGTGPGAGGGSGGGSGGGVGSGTGAGSGPGSGGGGEGGSGREPQWTYGTFFFEKPPKALRGQTLRVTFYVRADGRVSRVETVPQIDDGDFARKFAERAETYRFKPARNAQGVAVAGTYTMNFTLASKD